MTGPTCGGSSDAAEGRRAVRQREQATMERHDGHDVRDMGDRMVCRTCSNLRNVAYRSRLRARALVADPIGGRWTRRELPVRFWRSVRRGAADQCWPWLGATVFGGYGAFRLDGRLVRAHRVAFFLSNGRWPAAFVLHACDNPPCCNPDHLFEGTNDDNVHDMIAKGRHAHGERIPSARLTAADVVAIRIAHSGGASAIDLAQAFGVSPSTVKDAVTRRTWRHVP